MCKINFIPKTIWFYAILYSSGWHFGNRNELNRSMWEESVCLKHEWCRFSTQNSLYFSSHFLLPGIVSFPLKVQFLWLQLRLPTLQYHVVILHHVQANRNKDLFCFSHFIMEILVNYFPLQNVIHWRRIQSLNRKMFTAVTSVYLTSRIFTLIFRNI